jgi:hypothetical protein
MRRLLLSIALLAIVFEARSRPVDAMMCQSSTCPIGGDCPWDIGASCQPRVYPCTKNIQGFCQYMSQCPGDDAEYGNWLYCSATV